jgi:hypothetical protein
MAKPLYFEDDQLIEMIRLKEQEGLSNRKIAKEIGCGSTTVDSFFLRMTYKEFWESHDKDPIAKGDMTDPIERREPYNGKRTILITSAQNNTFIHTELLKTFKVFMEHNDAELMVGTFSYAQKKHERSVKGAGWYDQSIREYIKDKPVQLAPDLVFCGELNVSPTAVNPLSGFTGYGRGSSIIVPSVKQHLETTPTQKGLEPRLMYSTGTVTQRNYIQRKAGQKAEFHHIYGALVVELCDDGRWFVRQINAESETGNFYDLDKYYTPNGVRTGCSIAGLVPGDIHTNHIEIAIAKALFGMDVVRLPKGRMKFDRNNLGTSAMEILRPEHLAAHDVLDFAVRNHHNIDNPHFRFMQHIKAEESIEDEMMNVGEFLSALEYDFCTPVVVSSNHDRALIRYMIANVRNWAEDPVNAIFFLKTQLELYKAMERRDPDWDPVEWNIKRLCPKVKKTCFLRQDEQFSIAGSECGQHGDVGPNGSRGAINGFVKLGQKMVVGHSHTAAIKDALFQVGIVCGKNPSYAKGPSSWSWSFCIIYKNGKRTMVTMYIDKNGVAHWHR